MCNGTPVTTSLPSVAHRIIVAWFVNKLGKFLANICRKKLFIDSYAWEIKKGKW